MKPKDVNNVAQNLVDIFYRKFHTNHFLSFDRNDKKFVENEKKNEEKRRKNIQLHCKNKFQGIT